MGSFLSDKKEKLKFWQIIYALIFIYHFVIYRATLVKNINIQCIVDLKVWDHIAHHMGFKLTNYCN